MPKTLAGQWRKNTVRAHSSQFKSHTKYLVKTERTSSPKQIPTPPHYKYQSKKLSMSFSFIAVAVAVSILVTVAAAVAEGTAALTGTVVMVYYLSQCYTNKPRIVKGMTVFNIS